MEFLCIGHGFQDPNKSLRLRDQAASTKPNFTETNDDPSFQRLTASILPFIKRMKTKIGGSLSSYLLAGTGTLTATPFFFRGITHIKPLAIAPNLPSFLDS